MRKVGAAVSSLIVLALLADAMGQPSQLTCNFHDEAAFFVKPDRVDRGPRGGGGFVLVFTDLDSDSPILRAQLGEGPLRVIFRGPKGVWLGEPTLDGLMVYTIFRDAGVAMLSKQYYSWLGDEHVGIIAVGRCH